MSQGVFLSLDGVDGAGKSTQCRLLANWLRDQDRPVTLCRDPGGTPLGDRIRELLLDGKTEMALWCEAFLYMASRAQLVNQVIRPALAEGQLVVSDRYLLANVVYQGYGGGLPVEQLWQVGHLATAGVEPYLTLVLDLPPEVAATRKTAPADRMESRGVEFYARVRAGFLSEAQRCPERIKVLDATASIEGVQERLRQEVAHVLGARPRS